MLFKQATSVAALLSVDTSHRCPLLVTVCAFIVTETISTNSMEHNPFWEGKQFVR
jgi:hypothetical protein